MRYHNWFISGKRPKYLEEYLTEMYITLNNAKAYASNENIQDLVFTFICCISLDEIEDRGEGEGQKISQIQEWITLDKLLRIPLSCDENEDFWLWNKYIPQLSRKREKNENNLPKYFIIDGVNRIDVARRNNYKYILTQVEESFEISKDEMIELGNQKEISIPDTDKNDFNILLDLIIKKLNDLKTNKYFPKSDKNEIEKIMRYLVSRELDLNND
ncbi:MAG: hypothetical protein HeimC3_32410 [Candidatus Heimdallarchaeota archaeon LC_3]|nr:MAG: hypothetical protein HeimC3_32410 [Candidatus Heimdallarchaeota archaeon LC_3]